uniref:Uncharacterized protein n=1 Tax=Arundo donax TaxID=35708 RepID=A0A0A9B0B6_ARUDO
MMITLLQLVTSHTLKSWSSYSYHN